MRLFLLRQGCPSALNLRSKYLGALHVGNACWQTVFDCHLSFLLVPLPVLFYTYVEVEWSAFETSRRLQTGLPVRRSKQYVSRLVLFPPSVQETGVIRRRRFFSFWRRNARFGLLQSGDSSFSAPSEGGSLLGVNIVSRHQRVEAVV